MTTLAIERPKADEHSPYFSRYIDRVPEGDLIALLELQFADTLALLRRVPRDREDFAYADGKWTVKEVVGHLSDAERVFAYRALRFARNDPTELASFDENAWVANANFGRLRLADVVDEFNSVRQSTLRLAKNLNADELARRGVANGNAVSVRALFYIIAGHERHHVGLFRERYQLS
jgi:DinB family protein